MGVDARPEAHLRATGTGQLDSRLLIDSITDYAICTVDRSAAMLSWHAGAERVYGYSAAEVIGRSLSMLYRSGTAGEAEAHLRGATCDSHFRATAVHIRKDGSTFRGETVITSMCRGDGVVEAFAVVTRPLAAESGGAGVELGDHDELYRLLVQSVSDYAIFMLDTDGNVTSWNEGAERINGYAAHEIIGQHFSKFYPPEALASRWPWRELEFAAADGRFEDEGWRVRKDGSRFWTNVVITALRAPDGRLIGYSKVTRDLTERKAAEEALRTSEERYRLLVAGVKDYAIFMLDPEGCVATWNEGAERMKGYNASEIMGRHFSTFYPEEAVASRWPWRELELASADGRFEDEGWRVRKDGTRFWANVVITALRGENGRLVGYTKVTRDLTDRWRTEQQIRSLNEQLQLRVQELAESSRQVAQKSADNEIFVYSVSHDVRSPLVNLQGFSHEMKYAAGELRALLADSSIPAHVQERARAIIDTGIGDSVKHVQSAVAHLSNIVDGLLRLSRAGRIVYQRTNVPLRAIIDRIISSFDGTIGSRGARVTVDDLPTVSGDAAALEQLFSNLISNALNYLEPGREGLIRIGTLAPERDREIVFVQDNGAGLPAVAQAKLFQVFQRFHPQLAPGEGMGLAIAQRIVERHDGRIWAESGRGDGTTFYIALPRASATASST
jgi:PAS domain S-box-containing protein